MPEFEHLFTWAEMMGVIGITIFIVVIPMVVINIFDRRSRVQRERTGYDYTGAVVIYIIIMVILAGILKAKGLL